MLRVSTRCFPTEYYSRHINIANRRFTHRKGFANQCIFLTNQTVTLATGAHYQSQESNPYRESLWFRLPLPDDGVQLSDTNLSLVMSVRHYLQFGINPSGNGYFFPHTVNR